MTSLTMILFACAALQTPSNPPDAKAVQDWSPLDQVVAIVNQDIITYRKLARDLVREKEQFQLNNPSEMQTAQSRILTRRVKALLAKQAGQDMGADEKLVERNVQDSFERIVANKNGVVGMAKVMQAQDVSTQDVKDELREELYSRVWKDSITGEGVGLAARSNRDRYVRPGEIKFRYERALRDPQALRQMGGTTETVTLQTLTLDSDKNGGRDATVALAVEIQKSLATDADMNELVRRYSVVKENDGIAEPAEIARLRPLSASLAKFIDGRPADPKLWPRYISEPIVIQDTGARLIIRIARIREMAAGSTPSIATSAVQEFITTQAQDSLDNYRLESAYSNLYRAAYVWPPEQSAQPKR
ncbi:MAG: hypothetical protein SGI72_16890 [Planctomycetota bacterium]|nr:hypothetical protein [Planctomycetota bacterium]